MIMELRKKAQVTIPKEVVDSLGLKEGDQLEVTEHDGIIQLIPVVVYPKKYVDELREEIVYVKKKISDGNQPIFDSVDEMFKQLEQ